MSSSSSSSSSSSGPSTFFLHLPSTSFTPPSPAGNGTDDHPGKDPAPASPKTPVTASRTSLFCPSCRNPLDRKHISLERDFLLCMSSQCIYPFNIPDMETHILRRDQPIPPDLVSALKNSEPIEGIRGISESRAGEERGSAEGAGGGGGLDEVSAEGDVGQSGIEETSETDTWAGRKRRTREGEGQSKNDVLPQERAVTEESDQKDNAEGEGPEVVSQPKRKHRRQIAEQELLPAEAPTKKGSGEQQKGGPPVNTAEAVQETLSCPHAGCSSTFKTPGALEWHEKTKHSSLPGSAPCPSNSRGASASKKTRRPSQSDVKAACPSPSSSEQVSGLAVLLLDAAGFTSAAFTPNAPALAPVTIPVSASTVPTGARPAPWSSLASQTPGGPSTSPPSPNIPETTTSTAPSSIPALPTSQAAPSTPAMAASSAKKSAPKKAAKKSAPKKVTQSRRASIPRQAAAVNVSVPAYPTLTASVAAHTMGPVTMVQTQASQPPIVTVSASTRQSAPAPATSTEGLNRWSVNVCPTCNKSFTGAKAWLYHRDKVHPPGPAAAPQDKSSAACSNPENIPIQPATPPAIQPSGIPTFQSNLWPHPMTLNYPPVSPSPSTADSRRESLPSDFPWTLPESPPTAPSPPHTNIEEDAALQALLDLTDEELNVDFVGGHGSAGGF
ncbi:hypothetical protein HK104_000749, partial [Borealophlyctis nickersoniae]